MPHDATRRDERPPQGTHSGDPHRGDPHRGTTQGTPTGDPHRGEGPTEDPPPEGRATQGTHTEHTQTIHHTILAITISCEGQGARDEPRNYPSDILLNDGVI